MRTYSRLPPKRNELRLGKPFRFHYSKLEVNKSVPNGGEVSAAGSVQQIKWHRNLRHTDHLIIHYSRDGGASWFRIAQDVPALSFSYSWQVDNFPTTQGRVKIFLQGNRSITDQSDANFTVQRTP
jgi:hypothetical protein